MGSFSCPADVLAAANSSMAEGEVSGDLAQQPISSLLQAELRRDLQSIAFSLKYDPDLFLFSAQK